MYDILLILKAKLWLVWCSRRRTSENFGLGAFRFSIFDFRNNWYVKLLLTVWVDNVRMGVERGQQQGAAAHTIDPITETRIRIGPHKTQ